MEFHNTNNGLENKSYETVIFIYEKTEKKKTYLPHIDNKRMW